MFSVRPGQSLASPPSGHNRYRLRVVPPGESPRTDYVNVHIERGLQTEDTQSHRCRHRRCAMPSKRRGRVGGAVALVLTLITSGSLATADAVPPQCLGQPATILGSSGPDTLSGTAGSDVIVGLAGNDKISGAGGDDLICGGAGDDRLSGGAGDDTVDGAAG